MFGQISFLAEQEVKRTGCYACDFFAELKTPRRIKDDTYIYGYCFKKNGVYTGIDQKGYAVYIPEAKCKDHREKTRRTAKLCRKP